VVSSKKNSKGPSFEDEGSVRPRSISWSGGRNKNVGVRKRENWNSLSPSVLFLVRRTESLLGAALRIKSYKVQPTTELQSTTPSEKHLRGGAGGGIGGARKKGNKSSFHVGSWGRILGGGQGKANKGPAGGTPVITGLLCRRREIANGIHPSGKPWNKLGTTRNHRRGGLKKLLCSL